MVTTNSGQATVDTPALISVIVPVYNVAPYLRVCVDGILAQTYGNLEIILVDDGSPDECPGICDEYAVQDPRVRVIHKSNGGLSDARNAGLDVATGDLIGFVDSDDVVEPRMFELLAEALVAEGAQVAGCSFYDITGEGRGKEHGVAQRRVLGSRDAVCLLIHDDELQNYVWNKLFDARLWQDVRFPVGQRYEDVNTTYRLLERAERTALIPQPLYGYRLREDGIVGGRTLAAELDCVRANYGRCEALLPRYPEERAQLVDGVLKAAVNAWPLIWTQRASLTEEQRVGLRELSAFVREQAPASDLCERLGVTGRLTLRLCEHPAGWSWWAASVADGVYRAKHGRRG